MMKYEIVGRKNEIKRLDQILNSNEAEFLALYGRRRVGKTYLIRQYFQAQTCLFFEVSGLKEGDMHTQLELFTLSIEKTFYNSRIKLQIPSRWLDAFELLTHEIKRIAPNRKIVFFFDELPWLATKKSGLLQALDYYWNNEWVKNSRLKLIVCGSAASWMLEKLVHAKGGLYNRITARIHLYPFNLYETKAYLKFRGVDLDEQQILERYMVMGGIPHYLKMVTRGYSATQNINKICFSKDGPLFDEFTNLFASLFNHSEAHMEIIKVLAQNRNGLSRNELLKKISKSSSGGTFKERIEELEAAGFVTGFVPYGRTTRGTSFRVIDEYTLFYLKWIDPVKSKFRYETGNYWQSKSQTPAWKSWAGFAFEAVCHKHIQQINRSLDIEAMAKEIGSWRYIPGSKSKETGAQIDLLIDRADGIINICEIKYSATSYTIDKKYAGELQNKLETFARQTKSQKQLFLAMITTLGLNKNQYSKDLVHRSITLKDLFKRGSDAG